MAPSPKTKAAKVTSAADIKKKRLNAGVVLELPSGIAMRIKRPGMDHFLRAGFLPDSLAAMVKREIKAAQGGRPGSSVEKMMGDLEAEDIAELVGTMDRVVAYCVSEPEVRWHQRTVMEPAADGSGLAPSLDSKGREQTEDIPEDERSEDFVYTDELAQEDKNFIFQYVVGGSPDLARFRAATASLVAAVPAGEAVEKTPERDSAAG